MQGNLYCANAHAAGVAISTCPKSIATTKNTEFQNITKNSGLSKSNFTNDFKVGYCGSKGQFINPDLLPKIVSKYSFNSSGLIKEPATMKIIGIIIIKAKTITINFKILLFI